MRVGVHLSEGRARTVSLCRCASLFGAYEDCVCVCVCVDMAGVILVCNLPCSWQFFLGHSHTETLIFHH